MIVIKCPSCGKTYANVKPALIGQSTRCKACQTKFVIDISETFAPNNSSQDHPGSISKNKRQVEKTIDDEFIEFADAWLGGDQATDSEAIDKVPAIPPRIKEDLYELLTEPKSEKPPALKPMKPKTQLPKRKDDSRLGRMPQMGSSRGFETQQSFTRKENFTRPPEIDPIEQNEFDFEEDECQVRPWTRGYARFIDTSLYWALVTVVMILSATIIGPLIILIWLIAFPFYMVYEAFCITSYATTPGKHIFGIMVIDADGNNLDFETSLKRAFRVFFYGFACGFPGISLLTANSAMKRITKEGITSWDEALNIQYIHKEMSFGRRLGAFICLFITFGIDVGLRIATKSDPTPIVEPVSVNQRNEIVPEKSEPVVTIKPKPENVIPPKVLIDPIVPEKSAPRQKQDPIMKNTVKGIIESDDKDVQKGVANVLYLYKSGSVTEDLEDKIYNQALLETSNGNVSSSVVAGMCEIRGAGTVRNLKTGEAKLIKAADGGDTLAMSLLGRLYYVGDSLEVNEVESRKWYKKGAELNDVICKIRYGYFLVEGIGGPEDQIEGLKILIESANKKDSLGMYYLGMIYLKDQDKTNDSQIEDLLDSSAKSGIISAMRLLSKIYLNGRLGDKDPGKSVEWLRNAAEQEDAESQEELGDLLFIGNKGVAKNLTEAKKWLEKAGVNGRSGAYISLGMMAIDLEGIEKAKSYWNQAVAMGDHDGTALIGQTLMKDATNQNEISVALNILEKSAMNGSMLGHVELARYYAYGKKINDRQGASQVVGLNPPTAFVICKFAAEKEYMNAIQLLADFYSDGIGTGQNKAIAQQLRTKAAKARNEQDNE